MARFSRQAWAAWLSLALRQAERTERDSVEVCCSSSVAWGDGPAGSSATWDVCCGICYASASAPCMGAGDGLAAIQEHAIASCQRWPVSGMHGVFMICAALGAGVASPCMRNWFSL
jgi:hypothetical protein